MSSASGLARLIPSALVFLKYRNYGCSLYLGALEITVRVGDVISCFEVLCDFFLTNCPEAPPLSATATPPSSIELSHRLNSVLDEKINTLQTWKVNKTRGVELVCQLVLIFSSGFRGAAGVLGVPSRNQVTQLVKNSTITSPVN